jgi:hypothetical protein
VYAFHLAQAGVGVEREKAVEGAGEGRADGFAGGVVRIDLLVGDGLRSCATKRLQRAAGLGALLGGSAGVLDDVRDLFQLLAADVVRLDLDFAEAVSDLVAVQHGDTVIDELGEVVPLRAGQVPAPAARLDLGHRSEGATVQNGEEELAGLGWGFLAVSGVLQLAAEGLIGVHWELQRPHWATIVTNAVAEGDAAAQKPQVGGVEVDSRELLWFLL